MRVPVWPTWSECGRQPLLVTARLQPTTPPSFAASASSTSKPSAEPTPRPPPTTTGAVASVTPSDSTIRSWIIVAVTDSGSVDLERPHGRRRAGNRLSGLDRMRCDRHDRHRRRESRLLVQRAAPLHAGHLPVVGGLHREAVRDERQIELGRRVGEHLVATVGAARRRSPTATAAPRPQRRPTPYASGP